MPPLDQFVLFGDSITEGSYDQSLGFAFGAQLQHDYRKIFNVVNLGYGGYNTRDALKILPRVFPTPEQARIKVLMIFFGANDSILKQEKDSAHVPIQEFEANIQAIVNHRLVKAHSPRIILVTPPPIEETCIEEYHTKLKVHNENPRRASQTRDYALAAASAVRGTDVIVLDLFTAFMIRSGGQTFDEKGDIRGCAGSGKDEGLAKLFTDGLHLSPAGYRILYEELVAKILINWPSQIPQKLEPPWKPWEVEVAQDDKE